MRSLSDPAGIEWACRNDERDIHGEEAALIRSRWPEAETAVHGFRFVISPNTTLVYEVTILN
jgi:hypothetical protein